MKYAIVTFGCRVNQADSLEIERQLRTNGGRPVGPEDAELVVVNTCSVTATADHGARQLIRRVARKNPQARIVATGCYATRAEDDVLALAGVTRVIPNPQKSELVRTLLPLLPPTSDRSQTTAERFGDGEGACGARMQPGVSGRTSYTLRVQTGCDEVCAYCIIPTTRGPGRSVMLRQVLAEVDRAAAEGFKEVALTGVHIGSYGRDLEPHTTLLELLRALDAHPAPLHFRLSSLEPMDCSEEVVDLVARSGRFLPHFHLPLQNASDRLLRAMRRPYSLNDYRRLVDTIRLRMPNAGIGSDLVVGFPGEQPEDVEANLRYLPRSPLTYLHVFPYSDRPDTEASKMTGKVRGDTVRARARAIREIGSELAARFRSSQLNTVRPALLIDGGRIAVTDNYLKVQVPQCLPDNTRARVRITSVDPLIGEVADA
jgi:threonylcarbamoyladenosine tRNA methylthiotransferase MtaB